MADNQRYFTLLTDKGKFKIAKATADKGEVKFSHFAIGDGGGQEVNPLPSQTGLVHEVWRTQLDSVEIDPKNPAAVIINAIIPHNVGGWWMREFGLFDIDGDMLAVVKPAPYYKATSAEGQLEDVFYEFQLVLGEQAQVVVLVDPTILWATRDYVETRRISTSQFMNTPWLPVKSLTLATPPNSNNQGDTYVVPANTKGAWVDKAGQIAEWNGKAWNFWQTQDGHGVGLPDGRVFTKLDGSYIEKIALDSQSGKWNYAEAGGTANELTATLNPKALVLPVGMILQLKILNTNTGSATLNINDLGAKPIFNIQGQALAAADLIAGSIIQLVHSGGAFVMTSSPSLIEAGGVSIFKKPGAFNWTFPAGVGRVWAEVYGAGGGAALYRDTPDPAQFEGEGGGGGGYAAGWVYRPPSGVISGYIGSAGNCTFSIGATAESGGTSSFGGISATGGSGANAFGAPGDGGYGVNGLINLAGQAGGDGSSNTYQFIGFGGDAAGPHGGKGSQSVAASWPGGGAMMAWHGTGHTIGEAAHGGVILSW